MPETPSDPADRKSNRMPSGIPFIIANEAAERFCFYGMRTVLVVFMTKYLLDRSGVLAPMTDNDATGWYHLFLFGVYFIPLFGGIIADAFLGKFRTVIWLSLVYCLGCAAMTFDQTRVGLFIGLALIAVGSGGIKPCVSANVGDQFGPANQHLLPRAFGWFYFSINAGSMISTWLTPWLMEPYTCPAGTAAKLTPGIVHFLESIHGPAWAFGVPGALMLVATIAFWMGRHRFVRVPPAGLAYVREVFSMAGLKSVVRLIPIFALMIPFSSLYDQSGSAWVLQATKMDLHFLGFDWLASQVQVVNPILVLVFIPFFSYAVYPAVNRVFALTPLRKIGIGLFITVVSFLIPLYVASLIAAGARPSIAWQMLAYVALTAAEVMINVTCLEFAYTQAPAKMKSLVMALYLMSIALGNLFTSIVNFVLVWLKQAAGLVLTEVQYYWLFIGLMFVTAVVFIPIAKRYRGQDEVRQATR